MSVAEKPQALLDYLRLAADYLAKCGSDSPRLDAELLLAHVLKLDRVALSQSRSPARKRRSGHVSRIAPAARPRRPDGVHPR